MELNIVKQDDKTLMIEAKDETVTLTNLISNELWEDKSVKEAAQIKQHPYMDEPKILVKVSKGKPKSALKKASDRVLAQTDEFRKEFKKALKK